MFRMMQSILDDFSDKWLNLGINLNLKSIGHSFLFINIFLLLWISIYSLQSKAFFFDANLLYINQNFKTATSASFSDLAGDLSIGFSINRRYLIGWNYGIATSESSPNGSATQTAVSEMGPKLVWFIDSQNLWGLLFIYNIIANATYTPAAGSEEKLRGTSMKISLAYQIPFNENWAAGFRLNYYSASYDESVKGASSLSKVSYSRSFIYPSIGFTYNIN